MSAPNTPPEDPKQPEPTPSTAEPVTPTPPPPPPASDSSETTRRDNDAAERAKSAARDAMGVFKTTMVNPVAGIGAAHSGLGEPRALGVGVVFALAAALGMALAGSVLTLRLLAGYPGGVNFEFADFFRSLISSLIGIAACAAAVYVLAPMFGGKTRPGSSVFIAGSAFLPWGLALFAASIIGAILSNRLGMILIGLLLIFAACYLILILNAGYRQIAGLDERRAAIATPSTLAATAAIVGLIGWLLA